MKRLIHGYRMLYGDGTNIWNFCVYEPTLLGWPLRQHPLSHSTMMHRSDLEPAANGFNWYGRLGTRQLPAHLDALPCGPKRIRNVGKFHRAQYRACYKMILRELPRLFRKYKVLSGSMGDISVDVYEPRVNSARNITAEA